VWSLEEWKPAPFSWRGRYAIEKPSLQGLESDGRQGPLARLPVLSVRRVVQLPPLNGPLADLAYEPATDRFLAATSRHGVYVLDGSLAHSLRQTVVDAAFSVDLGTFTGAAFVDSQTLALLGDNKSYLVLRETEGADADANFRYFLESPESFSEVSRGRFATVRARMMYTMSLAFDPGRDCFYTATVPNRRQKRLVVSRFSRTDMTLSEEFLPSLGAGSGLALAGPGRSLDEYYVTGLAAQEGRLYALSAAYNTLLELDPVAHEVTGAWLLEGISAPVGVALSRRELFVASADGRVFVFDTPRGPIG
jgi:disulfide bond formation protein DsbB